MKIVASILLLPLPGLLFAQASEPRREDHARVEVAKLLQKLAGTWFVTDMYDPSQAMPQGRRGKGTEIWRAGPGERSVIEEYRSEGGQGNQPTGFGLGWWDENSEGFRFDWCSDGDPNGCTHMSEIARWEAEGFVIRHRTIENGEPSEMKEVFSEFTPNSFTQTIYHGVPGRLKRFVTIKAVRSQ